MIRFMAVAFLALLPCFRVDAQCVVYKEDNPIDKAESIAELAGNLSFAFEFNPQDGILQFDLAARKTLPFLIGLDVLNEGGPGSVSYQFYHKGKEMAIDLKSILDAYMECSKISDSARANVFHVTDATSIRHKNYIWDFMPTYWKAIGRTLDALPKSTRSQVDIHIDFRPAVYFARPSDAPLYTGFVMAPAAQGDDAPNAFVVRMTAATYDTLRLKEKNTKRKTWINERSAVQLIPPRGALRRSVKTYFSEFDEELASSPKVEVPEEYARREERWPEPLSEEERRKFADRYNENTRRIVISEIKKLIIDHDLDPHGDEAKRLWKMLDAYP